MITPQLIYAQTQGGLDIILKYFPEANEKNNKKFRIVSEQEDPNPSCVLYLYNQIWRVKSFQTGEMYSPIDIVMMQEGVNFSDALKFIASNFNIEVEGVIAKKIKADYSSREAKEEADDFYSWEEKDFSIAECQKIFATNVWKQLCNKKAQTKEELKGDDLGLYNAKQLFAKYNFKSIKTYEFCGRDKKDKNKRVIHSFCSNELYPIFMFDEGSWQKIYKPSEPQSEFRFVSYGQKPIQYTFGIDQTTQMYESLVENSLAIASEEAQEGKESAKKEFVKLPEVIIATGGSDALNLAALGYQVVWFNSETIKKNDVPFFRLKGMAHVVYYVGDLDQTGKDEAMKLGLEYLDLHLIDLPETIKRFRDDKNGKQCKDLKDYLNIYKGSDFKNLLSNSYPLKFWETKDKYDRKGNPIMEFGKIVKEYKPDPELIYNFLKKHGYGRINILNRKEPMMVRVLDNVVEEIDGEQARKFIKTFLRENSFDRRLINTFHRSPDISDSSLEAIDDIDVDFTSHDINSQWLFFQNKNWLVTGNDILEYSAKKSGKFVWSDEIIKHDIKKIDAPFTIFYNNDGELDITINPDSNCLFLKYLINTSRVHWQIELEEKLDNLSKSEQEAYKEKYRFAIDGPLLTPEQIREQKTHLINKITSLGYLQHRYKEPAQSYCVWGMDYKQIVGQSYGGTGKSIAYYAALKNLMKHHYIEGRKSDVTTNQFLFGAVNEHTDLIYVDDAHEYLDFTRFFSIVTGSMEATKKGIDATIIEFDDSPKLCITSNYPPRQTDSATQRRMWFTTFSDYYHKNPNGEYREERDPKAEFGKNLFKEFTKEENNAWLNTMAYYLQAWLKFGKVDPPMKSVMENTYRAKMGPSFHAWADTFFGQEDGRLNAYVQRGFAYKSYQVDTTDMKLSPNGFLEKLNLWCLYNGYQLNPRDLLTTKDGRISKREYKIEFRNGKFESDNSETKACEMLYIRCSDIPVAIPVEKPVEKFLPF